MDLPNNILKPFRSPYDHHKVLILSEIMLTAKLYSKIMTLMKYKDRLLDHVVPDELHLFLRIMDILIEI